MNSTNSTTAGTINYFYKITNIICNIYKNGSYFTSAIVNASYNVQYNISSKLQSIVGEQFITMASISYTPTIDSNSSTYSIIFIVTVSTSNPYSGDYFNVYVNNGISSTKIYTQIYLNQRPQLTSFSFLNNSPSNYQAASFSESLNNPPVSGTVFMNELYVNTLHYLTLGNAIPAAVQIPVSLNDPNNPVFQNIYLDTSQTANPIIDFGYNDTSRDPNAGQIIYNGSSFDIYGCGSTVGNRNIQLFDNVTINNNLTVTYTLNCIIATIANLSTNNFNKNQFYCFNLVDSFSSTLNNVTIQDSTSIINAALQVGQNINGLSINCSGNITGSSLNVLTVNSNDLFYNNSIFV
jgi:hypothetical protein